MTQGLYHPVTMSPVAPVVWFLLTPMVFGLTLSSPPVACARRMEEVRAAEVRATVEDLLYVSILEKFVLLGVEMLPRMDGAPRSPACRALRLRPCHLHLPPPPPPSPACYFFK